MRTAIIAALGLALTLVSGCSALRLGYGAAPDLAYWWLDGYVDFDRAQSAKVHAAIADWFAWHRTGQLPDYAALLVRARAEVQVDVTPTRVCEWQADVIKRADIAFDRIAPSAAEVLLTITPEQIAHIESRYAKFNEEFADEYLQPDPAKRAAATLKRTLERAEMLYGSLDNGQRARMSAALARSPFDPEFWLTERKARQREALDLMRRLTQDRSATREQAQAALRGYVDHLERSPREPYRRYSDRLSEFNCAFAATLHNGTTAAQRRHAVKALAGWEGDLRALVAKTDPTPMQ